MFKAFKKLFGSEKAGKKFLIDKGISDVSVRGMKFRGLLSQKAIKILLDEAARKNICLTSDDFYRQEEKDDGQNN